MTSAVVILFIGYYIYLSTKVYNLSQKLALETGFNDLPEFSKIFWVPIACAFALFAIKLQLQNLSTPVFMLICKD